MDAACIAVPAQRQRQEAAASAAHSDMMLSMQGVISLPAAQGEALVMDKRDSEYVGGQDAEEFAALVAPS